MDSATLSSTPISRYGLDPHSIFCVGKNYREHALEMLKMEEESGAPPARREEEEPIIFMKPATALETEGRISVPHLYGRALSNSMHYEAELVLLVGKDTDGCEAGEAAKYVSAVGAGLDMTLRDVQLEAKKAGNPWLRSKGFRRSALVSDFHPLAGALPGSDWTVSLDLNGKRVQHAAVGEMIHPPAELVSYLSYLYGLRKGDLIFTGTPAGVGPVNAGDRLRAYVCSPVGTNAAEELAVLEAKVENPQNN
ncbi:fumarylacetoacetate hydrolase family protein [Chlorobium sp. N1]|uniref:fumarylacetoacetate hydrolase family protein n=1 Tax=Chlorobium sp. N1 TaxID=2491138 RepID=UPI00104053E3|nr:fumarylacetoacetate hydrolase family protein [Chlorobium sp. N1]TCD48328.1 FAA hydrolase family protein [Chlorobium sp. N1]